MAQIFNGRVYNSSPYPSAEINYEYTRDGANMKYHFWGKVYLESSGGWYYNNLRLKLYLNGSNVYTKDCKSSSKGWSIDWDAGWHTISNKTSGTTPFYFSVKDTQNSGWCNYTSGTYQLDVAPAYFSSDPTISLSSRTETSATFNWSTPETCSRIQYKIDNGWWVDVTMDANSKSGSFTITGLSANTNYRIYVDFMRRDSGLWAVNKPYRDISTYDYPHLTSVPEFTVGNSLTIGIYNPLGRSCTISVIGNNGVEHNGGTITGSTISPFNNYSWKNIWYSTLPSKTQGTYKARLVCATGNVNQLSGAVKYYLNTSDAGFKPTFTASDVINVVNTVNTAIAGSNKFIKNHNSLSGTIKPMTAQRSATGSYYNVSASGLTTVKKDYSSSNINFVLGNMSSNAFNVTAVDSRGFSTTISKTIDLVDYNNPGVTTAKITRQNGIGTKAILAFTGIYTDWTGLLQPNLIQSIRYKIGANGTWKTLPSDATLTSSGGIWTLNAVLNDDFATTSQYNLYLEIKDLLETVVVGAYTISTADAFIWKDLANKRLGIGKKPNYNLDVGGYANFDNDVGILGSLDVDGNLNCDGTFQADHIKIESGQDINYSGGTGYTVNYNGDWIHNRSTNTDRFTIKDNAGTNKLLYNYETGLLQLATMLQIGGSDLISYTSANDGYSVRFANGIQICFARKSVRVDCTSKWVVMYEGGASVGDFPQSFKSGTTPYVFVSNTNPDGYIEGLDSSTASAWGTLRMAIPTSASRTFKVNLFAIGFWK